jgi:hypothetical protein
MKEITEKRKTYIEEESKTGSKRQEEDDIIIEDTNLINSNSNQMFVDLSSKNENREQTRNSNITNIRQQELYTMSKNLVPVLDRLGRIVTDMGSFLNFNIMTNKLEEIDKVIFKKDQLDSNLKDLENQNQNLTGPNTSSNQQQQNNNSDITTNPRNTRNTNERIFPHVNKLDKQLTSQVPCIDTPLSIYNLRTEQTQPLVDIYVHTFVSGTGDQSRNNLLNLLRTNQGEIRSTSQNANTQQTAPNNSNIPQITITNIGLTQNNNQEGNNDNVQNQNTNEREENSETGEDKLLGKKRQKPGEEENEDRRKPREENIENNEIIMEQGGDAGITNDILEGGEDMAQTFDIIVEEIFENDAGDSEDNQDDSEI